MSRTVASSNGTGAASAASVLSESEARRLTDEVKTDVEALWAKLLRLYEGGAHKALGYKSWGAYWEAEFRQSAKRGYDLLDAGRVVRELEAHSPMGESSPPPTSERVARELKGSPQQKAKAWTETVKRHGPKPTAKQTKAVVDEVAPPAKRARNLKPAATPVSPRNRGGKRLTVAERQSVLWKLDDLVVKFTTALEHIDPRVIDTGRGNNVETLIHVRDHLIDLDIWKRDVELHIAKKIGDQGIREKIATLRNPNGKYPEELKRCREAADRLEAKLNHRLSA